MPFIAKYPGRCDDCRESINVGDEVEYKANGRLAHVVCDSVGALTDLDRDATREVCPVCFLLKPCVCEVPF